MTNDDLKQYVQTALKSGMSAERIEAELKRAGWSTIDIKEAFKPLPPETDEDKRTFVMVMNETAQKPVDTRLAVGIIIILLILLGSLIAYNYWLLPSQNQQPADTSQLDVG